MRATDLGYTKDDVMAGIEHFPFAKTLKSHTKFYTKQIARYAEEVKNNSDPKVVTQAKYHVHRMTSHYCELVNTYGDSWIDLKKNWNNEEIFGITFNGKTTFYSVPKGTGYKNCDTDMDNQRIEFYYLGKLITPQLLSDNIKFMIPKSNQLHIRSNPFALTKCVIHDVELLDIKIS
jgi:hypothetical protein